MHQCDIAEKKIYGKRSGKTYKNKMVYLKLPLEEETAIGLRREAPVAIGSDATSNCIGLSSLGIGGKGGRMGEGASVIAFAFTISLPYPSGGEVPIIANSD